MCIICHLINIEDDKVNCPYCGSDLFEPQCPACGHKCECPDEINAGIAFCPECGKIVCPKCGSSDCVAISRITGLVKKLCACHHSNLSDVSGWRESKLAELKDRHRYDISKGV